MPIAEVFAYSSDILSPDALDGETQVDVFLERGLAGRGLETYYFPGNAHFTSVSREGSSPIIGVFVEDSLESFTFWTRFDGTQGNSIVVTSDPDDVPLPIVRMTSLGNPQVIYVQREKQVFTFNGQPVDKVEIPPDCVIRVRKLRDEQY